jgi:hypothetical protein
MSRPHAPTALSHVRLNELSPGGGRLDLMTFSTLIIVNATLGLVLVYMLVHFLAQAIHADARQRAVRAAEVRSLPSRERDRVAA